VSKTNVDILNKSLKTNFRKRSNAELNRLNTEEFKAAQKIPLVVVLDNIRSLNNIGSIFRTADAFRIEEVLLCGITARPPHKDIRKTALGATESVAWRYFEQTQDALNDLRSKNYKIAAVEQAENAYALNDFEVDLSQGLAVVFGHEVQGVAQEVVDLCDAVIEIPQFGTKHSLNVSVSAGIVLWNLNGQFFSK
jgi:tRNA G18 (ribose-2'-O)-methylase SpoU